MENENRNTVELLLNYGARTDFLSDNPCKPLELAKTLYSHTIVQMLESAMRSSKAMEIHMLRLLTVDKSTDETVTAWQA